MEKSSEQKIIDFIKEEGEVSASKMSVYLGFNFHKVERILAELVSKDVIEFTQKTRGNYYKIKKSKGGKK